MVNRHNQLEEGDYQFAENEVPKVNDAEPLKVNKKSVLKKLDLSKVKTLLKNNPRTVKIVLLILSLFVIFKILVFSSNRTRSQAVQELAQVHNVIEETKTPSSTEIVTKPVQNFMDTLSKTENQNKESFADKKELQQLEKNVAILQQDLSKLAAFMIEMQNQTDALNQKMDDLQVKIDRLTTQPKAKVVNQKPTVQREKYTIRAIVPGRAWLISAKGDSIDVKVGDILPGYGEIKLIAPKKGLIFTADGSIIKLGRYDS